MAKYKGYDYAQWSGEQFPWDILTPRLEYVDVTAHFDVFPAQRDLDEERARGMAEVFLPACADGVRIAVIPDGRRFVVDGQHRIRAAQYADCAGLWALVYDLPSYEQAAAMFHNVNGDGVVRTSPQAALNSARESRRPREIHLWDILDELGVSLVPTENRTHIQAASVVARIYDVDEGDLLALTIDVVTECWGVDYYRLKGHRHKIPVLSDPILEGMALFLAHHPQVTERSFLIRELKRTLGKRDVAELMEKASSSWGEMDHKPKLAFHVEREVVSTFNHNRPLTGGNRLPDRTARELMKLGDLNKLRRVFTPDEDQEGA